MDNFPGGTPGSAVFDPTGLPAEQAARLGALTGEAILSAEVRGYERAREVLAGVAYRTGSPAARWAAGYLAADPDRMAPAARGAEGSVPAAASVGRFGDWMQTFTGGVFYPLDPRPEDVDPADIAHALSLICRYGGHSRRKTRCGGCCTMRGRRTWVT